MTSLKPDPELWPTVVWSPTWLSIVCALCAGPLPEVPFMLFEGEGDACKSASFCDECVKRLFSQVKKVTP
jgi:hypothetical protein